MLSCELLAAAKEELPSISLKVTEALAGPMEEWMEVGRFNLAILYRSVDNLAGC